MNKSLPTGGEWIYWESHDEGLSISGKEDNHPVIAVTNPDLENEEANAKLISAAPDLLSACLMAKEELVFGGDWETAKRIIEEAVNKAKL